MNKHCKRIEELGYALVLSVDPNREQGWTTIEVYEKGAMPAESVMVFSGEANTPGITQETALQASKDAKHSNDWIDENARNFALNSLDISLEQAAEKAEQHFFKKLWPHAVAASQYFATDHGDFEMDDSYGSEEDLKKYFTCLVNFAETMLSCETLNDGTTYWSVSCDPESRSEALWDVSWIRFYSKSISELLATHETQAMQSLRDPKLPLEVKSKSI